MRAVAQLSTLTKKKKNGANLGLRHALRAGGVIRREQVMCCVRAGIALTDELLLSFIFYQHASRSVGSSQATVSNLL